MNDTAQIMIIAGVVLGVLILIYLRVRFWPTEVDEVDYMDDEGEQ